MSMLITKDIFVDGSWQPSASDRTITVLSPSTEEPVAQVPDANAADVDRAVAAARAAFDQGPWPRLTPAERAQYMLALLAELTARTSDLERVITTENGTPQMLVGYAQVSNALDVLRYYADLAADFEVETPREGRYTPLVVRREPVGCVAAIVPWNVPLFLSMMKLAPSMAAGCTMVLKAAPETPLNANLLAEAALAADLPPGVLNVIAAGPESSELLVTHPGIDKVAFTGSTAVGMRIAGLAASQLKRVTLELGGKSAAIVLDENDLSKAMQGVLGLTMSLTGQFCTAQSRILVSRARYDEAVEVFAAMASGLPVGDPFQSSTFMGPLISQRQRDRVLGYVEIGKNEGATLVTGGGRPADLDRGWFVEPTVFRDVTRDMRIAQEEIFGPVVAFIPYDDEEDAIAIANDSAFGLHGTVWTDDIGHGLEVGRRIRTGTFTVNGMSLDPAAPFGGMKHSGMGREMGPEGLSAYLESKTITVPVGTQL
jgi:aldehyde dehydrogenase (NAD+)